MLDVNRKNDRIIGALNGKPFNVSWSKEKHTELRKLSAEMGMANNKEEMEKLISIAETFTSKNINEDVAAANGYLKYKTETGTYHLVVNKDSKRELVSKDPLPTVLAKRIVESFEEGSDYMPILLAWRRFITRRNCKSEDRELFAKYLTSTYVDYAQKEELIEIGTSPEVAEELATYYDISITTFGLLATYKVVDIVKKKFILENDENGVSRKKEVEAFPSTISIDEVTGEITKEEGAPTTLEEVSFKPAIWSYGHKFYCGNILSYKYMIGKEAILPEEAPRNFNNTSGGGGLYSGGLEYIRNYRNDSNEVLTCFVDPSEIISFQDEGRAFRTNRMFINGTTTMEGEMSGMYFVSDYAKESNARIEERFQEALKGKEEAEAEKMQAEDLDAGVISDILG